jgi:tetratricopeptide (TPR) repeat protein
MGRSLLTAFSDLLPHLPIAQSILEKRAATIPLPPSSAQLRDQAREIRAALFRLSQPLVFETTFDHARKTHDDAKAAAAAGQKSLAEKKFADAYTAYRQALDQARLALPPNSMQLAGYLNQIAQLLKDLGRYQDGIPPLKKQCRLRDSKPEQ